MPPIPAADLFASLPPDWPTDLLPEIRRRVQSGGQTLVVLDDDPTGTQTVHGVPVLTAWDADLLAAELRGGADAFYVLTNSRSLPLPQAQALNREIGQNLRAASAQAGRDVAVVSRSDSTLRGHFPGEVEALADGLGVPFDAWLIVPFFLEGGRYTVADVHYVAEGGDLIPAGETPFARDAAFGYRSSDLRAWVAEKTGGRVTAEAVESISIDDLRRGGPDRVQDRLLALPRAAVCAVNAASYRDLEAFVLGLLRAEAEGRRYLYRTAASFVRVRAGIMPRALLSRADLPLGESGGGLIVVGSYVPKTTGQLGALLAQPGVDSVEIETARLLDDAAREGEVARVAEIANRAMQRRADLVIYTSRALVSGPDATASLTIGGRVSDGLIEIVRRLDVRPRYLLAKGGITSSDVATKGLAIRRADVLGQILPGVPVWQTGAESRFPGLAYIVFPGNVGGADALAQIVAALAQA